MPIVRFDNPDETDALPSRNRRRALALGGCTLAAVAATGAAVAATGVAGAATGTAPVPIPIHGAPLTKLPAFATAARAPRKARHHKLRVTGAYSSRTGAGDYSIPASIVMCESGGNYSAVNASTGAGGAYQILPSTWAAYGGTGLPQDAPPAEQNAIAAKIYASAGPGQWVC
jgi:hypothetical protein